MNSSKYRIEKYVDELIENSAQRDMNSQEWISFCSELYLLLEKLQSLNLSNIDMTIDCKKGCSFCCNHWVEDVYFFEALSITDYLKENLSADKLETIRQAAKESEQIFQELYDSDTDIDEVELLNSFYEKQIPCPLLDKEGKCIAYSVRPLTCRSFFSESAAKHCNPETRDSEGDGTFMVTPGDDIETKLDELHLTYGENFPLSLRAMLAFMV